jgi:uncharacterized protein
VRVILDTNILLAALMVRGTPPDRLFELWKERRFELVTCEAQLEELNRVTRRPFFRKRLMPGEAGRLINDLRRLARRFDALPRIERSSDPNDDFLLALAEVARADYLVTGDRSGLLNLKNQGITRIVTARYLLEHLEE